MKQAQDRLAADSHSQALKIVAVGWLRVGQGAGLEAGGQSKG